jgi:hypothetical protein
MASGLTRPAPPFAGAMRPSPPFTGGRRYNWHGPPRWPWGAAAFGPFGNGSPYALATGGDNVVVEDVYDDDNADMGCEGDFVQPVGSMADLSEPKGSEPRLGHEAKVNFGHEVTISAASGPAKCTFGQESGYQRHRHHHHPGGMTGGYGGQYGGMGSGAGNIPPAPPPPIGYGQPAPPPPIGYGRPAPPPPTVPWASNPQTGGTFTFGAERGPHLGATPGGMARYIAPPVSTGNRTPRAPTTSHLTNLGRQVGRFHGGEDASFGWMMPTLPGAISESPLRGVFAPDVGLTGSLGLGGLG